ncbi:MAG: BON domain-containing protein [Alphaproteobacteria bacterium]|nr:BON domain-containing protein [Alphaproteobacteria bacterium]
MRLRSTASVLCTALLLAPLGAAAEEKPVAIQPPQQAAQPSDSQLKRSIEGRMLDARAVFFADIDIDVIEGDVLLTGHVRDPKDKARAAALVRSVPGTHTVVNEINIGKPSTIQQAASDLDRDRRIKTALYKAFGKKKMPLLRWRSVDGVVYVFGHARTEWEHNRALAVIKKTKDVKTVVDHLSIVANANAR